MTFGLELALVLRAKGGSSFLLQSHGIGARTVNEACRQAADVLASYAESGGAPDVDRTGDVAPSFSCGSLVVGTGRLCVIYRLVSAVYVMAVAPTAANMLLCLEKVDALAHLLVAAARGIDVTPEKIARRYPEVYLASGMILTGNTGTLDASQLLALGESQVNTFIPDAAGKGKGTAAVIKKGLGVTSLSRLSRGVPSSSQISFTSQNLAGPASSYQPNLKLEEDPLSKVSFMVPPEDLTPQPFSTETTRAAPSSAPKTMAPAQPLDALMAPAVPVAGSEFLAGTGLETLSAPVAGYDTALPPMPVATDNPWSLESPASTVDPFAQGFPGSGDAVQRSSQLPNRVPEPALPEVVEAPEPQPKAEELKAIARGQALQLVELWRACFVGGTLTRAGTLGEVVGSGAVSTRSAEAIFRLTATEDASAIVASTLNAASVNGELASKGEDRLLLTAKLGRAPSGQAPFLTYRLPAVSLPPPVLLSVAVLQSPRPSAATESISNGSHAEAAVAVQIAVGPSMAGALRGAVLDLDVPAILGQPMKVRPPALWAARQRRFRWQLGALEAESLLDVRAVFAPRNAAGTAIIASQTTATLHFYGPPGITLSGISLESGRQAHHLHPSRAVYHGEVTARPSSA